MRLYLVGAPSNKLEKSLSSLVAVLANTLDLATMVKLSLARFLGVAEKIP
jgi:hypothetical protein